MPYSLVARVREHAQIEEAKQRDEKISVRLPDGKEVEAVRGVTTPLNIAKGISSKLSKEVLVAKVDGKVCERRPRSICKAWAIL